MRRIRPVLAIDPRLFGRGPFYVDADPQLPAALDSDLRLFASTFLGGFLFVSILLV